MNLEWQAPVAPAKLTSEAMPQKSSEAGISDTGDSAFGNALEREVKQGSSSKEDSGFKFTRHGENAAGTASSGDDKWAGCPRTSPGDRDLGSRSLQPGINLDMLAQRQAQTPGGAVARDPGTADDTVSTESGLKENLPDTLGAESPSPDGKSQQNQSAPDLYPQLDEGSRPSPEVPEPMSEAPTGKAFVPEGGALEDFKGLEEVPAAMQTEGSPSPDSGVPNEVPELRTDADPPLGKDMEPPEQPLKLDMLSVKPVKREDVVPERRERDSGTGGVPRPENVDPSPVPVEDASTPLQVFPDGETVESKEPKSPAEPQPQFSSRFLQTLPETGRIDPENSGTADTFAKVESTLMERSLKNELSGPSSFPENEVEIDVNDAIDAIDGNTLSGRDLQEGARLQEIARPVARHIADEDNVYESDRVTRSERQTLPQIEESLKREPTTSDSRPIEEPVVRVVNEVNSSSYAEVSDRAEALSPVHAEPRMNTKPTDSLTRELRQPVVKDTLQAQVHRSRDIGGSGNTVRGFVAENHDLPEKTQPDGLRRPDIVPLNQGEKEPPVSKMVYPEQSPLKTEKNSRETDKIIVKSDKSLDEDTGINKPKAFVGVRPGRSGLQEEARDSRGQQDSPRGKAELHADSPSPRQSRSGPTTPFVQQVREVATANTENSGLGQVVKDLAGEEQDKDNRSERRERVENLPNRVDKDVNLVSNTKGTQRMAMTSRVSTTQEAYLKVMAAVERMSSTGETSRMQLRLQFEDGEEMKILFKFSKGLLHTVFMTDSDGLRSAMRDGWEQIQRQLLERGVEADQPDFQQSRQDSGNRNSWDDVSEDFLSGDSLQTVHSPNGESLETDPDSSPHERPDSPSRTLHAYA